MGVKVVQAGLTVGSIVAFVVGVGLMITTGDSADPHVNLWQFIGSWACFFQFIVMGMTVVQLCPNAAAEKCDGL